MLNRRFLRIKALQGVYAYRQQVTTNLNIAKAHLDELFVPDILAETKPDEAQVKYSQEKAQVAFNDLVEKGELSGEVEPEILEQVNKAVNHFKKLNDKDYTLIERQLKDDTFVVVKHFFNVLQLMLDMQMHVELLRDGNKAKRLAKPVAPSEFNLANNKLLNSLLANSDVQSDLAKHGENWMEEGSILKSLYNDVVLKNEEYLGYQKVKNPTYEEDREVVLRLLKKGLFKNELFLNHFEEKDVRWAENEEIVQTLVLKSIKRSSEEGFKVFSLSENWEEDQRYFETLFSSVAKGDEKLQRDIAGRSKNWDEDRVALMDLIIMEMALVEMIEFSSIPVKVSINEFIELSKEYSTPKSKSFINGILDAISKDYLSKKVIRKSGRGLVDNK